MNKLKLYELRQLNCGYNPEKAEDIGKVDEVDNFTLYITDEETNHTMVFYKETTINNQIEFIENYPKTFGVVYKGSFYLQAD